MYIKNYFFKFSSDGTAFFPKKCSTKTDVKIWGFLHFIDSFHKDAKWHWKPLKLFKLHCQYRNVFLFFIFTYEVVNHTTMWWQFLHFSDAVYVLKLACPQHVKYTKGREWETIKCFCYLLPSNSYKLTSDQFFFKIVYWL